MNVVHLMQVFGLPAIAAIIFAESGMLVGFFLPGDTLLLSAGVLASQGQFDVRMTIFVVILATILGDNTGYQLGRVMGPRLFRKQDGILFRQEYVSRAEKFYEKYGAKTMLVSHYIPIVRSFAPLVAGVGKMPRGKFFLFNAIGDITWAVLIILLGYAFGRKIPNLDHYITPVILAVVVISISPVLWHLFGEKEGRERLFKKLRGLSKSGSPKSATKAANRRREPVRQPTNTKDRS